MSSSDHGKSSLRFSESSFSKGCKLQFQPSGPMVHTLIMIIRKEINKLSRNSLILGEEAELTFANRTFEIFCVLPIYSCFYPVFL